MKYFITLFLLPVFLFSFELPTDTRAELNIKGEIREISVSPSGRLWLVTSLCQTYYAENIQSDWHQNGSLTGITENEIYSNNLNRITFFNKDTAILTGYISAPGNDKLKGGYYFTTDGGRNWELRGFGGSEWIYEVFTEKDGKAWMGGSSGEMFYSSDYGATWTKLNSPYNSSSRTISVFMRDSMEGISAALQNFIYSTTDNWQTSKKIETPLDQKKYVPVTHVYNDNRFQKIRFWKNFIVANQNGHIYYSDKNEIRWKEFSTSLIDFEVDAASEKLFGITSDLKIISFTAPDEFVSLSEKKLGATPKDIKVVNHSLFVLDKNFELYQINSTEFIASFPLTNDYKLKDPTIIRQSKKLTWGFSEHQIYLSENGKKNWRRENTVAFSIVDVKLVNDSLALLWDGIKNCYTYSLKNHSAELYAPVNPLAGFLESPIKSFTIKASNNNYKGRNLDIVTYKKTDASVFETDHLIQGGGRNPGSVNYQNKVSAQDLQSILSDINSNPSVMPSLKDFQITEADKKKYLHSVDSLLDAKWLRSAVKQKKEDKDFYYSILPLLDTLSAPVFNAILKQYPYIYAKSNDQFSVQIVNEKNDTLTFSRVYYTGTLAYWFPWKTVYKGYCFNCYSLPFSKYIDSCISKDFLDKEIFDNSFLIMTIADYFYKRS